MKGKIFYLICAGFILGVFLHSFFYINFYFSLFLFIIAGCSLIYIFFFNKDILKQTSNVETILFFGIILLFSFSLGMIRYDFSEFSKNEAPYQLAGENVVLSGIVNEEPEEKENKTNIIFLTESVKFGKKETKIKTKILVSLERYPKYQYGDKLELTGKFTAPKNFSNDNQKIFDYVSYLAKDGIYFEMKFAKVKFISHGNGNFIKDKLFKLKNMFLSNLRAIISEPESALLGGLLLGEKQSLGKQLEDNLRKAGVIHMVVLSGYNITIVADSVIKFFSFLPTLFNVGFGILSIILFSIITGGTSTVIRASIMALLVILARSIGKKYDIKRALILAGIAMVFFNPKNLVFDVSFQLSFLATFSLIFLFPIIENYFYFLPKKFKFKEMVTSTVATQIFVLPFLLYKMGDFSLVALPVNILILLFVPATMFFGFISSLLMFISSIIALPFGVVTYGLLFYELKVVEIFSKLPFASFHINNFPLIFMLIFYFAIGIFIYKFSKNQSKLGPG